MHDVSMCAEVDQPIVRATIWALCSMEESTPLLAITVRPMNGYNAIIARGFNDDIDLDHFYDKFRLNPPEKIRGCISKVYVNGQSGVVVVRVANISEGGVIVHRPDAEPLLKRGKRERE